MSDSSIKDLELAAVIGFTGKIPRGLILHPDNEHLIFPLGSSVIIRNITNRTQKFLKGHDNSVSTVVVSSNGKQIATGQRTHMGFKAEIKVWDFETIKVLHSLFLHKVEVVALAFSYDEQQLASLGGQDDNNLVIWDLSAGKAVCGTTAAADTAHDVNFFHKNNDKLISVNNFGIRIWNIDQTNKKLRAIEVNLGQMRRHITNLVISANDAFVQTGTKTGDILEIAIDRAIFKRAGPSKKIFSQGVNSLALLPNGDLLVGCGDGTLAKLNQKDFKIKEECKLLGGVTSISLTMDSTFMFVSTNQCNIQWVDTDKLNPELRSTCHFSKINDICFPYNQSEVFATASDMNIRVWNAITRQELLRIQVPNLICNCICFSLDGKAILSGWDDGKIRSFLPISGKMLWAINDAHNHGCTSIASTNDNKRLVTGGMEGEVRIWKLSKQTQTMDASLKEHRARVNSIVVKNNDDHAVSASNDGSCIVWDIRTQTRINCVFDTTMFKQVLYHPDESQLVTTGSDRKITYWDCFDDSQLSSGNTAIRMLTGSESGEIHALAITKEGEHLLSGGEDKILKIWEYDTGIQVFVGYGHSSAITKIKVSPDQCTIVSTDIAGAIFVWKTPKLILLTKADQELPTLVNNK